MTTHLRLVLRLQITGVIRALPYTHLHGMSRDNFNGTLKCHKQRYIVVCMISVLRQIMQLMEDKGLRMRRIKANCTTL